METENASERAVAGRLRDCGWAVCQLSRPALHTLRSAPAVATVDLADLECGIVDSR